MSGYSKAPRGLSVLLRVTRIFTGTSISPSLSLRQRPNRYAFRAGRNLPDKEFRYLRTVIVTAAVHRGFSSELRIAANHFPLTFRHWAGVSPYTSSFDFAETCVFGKQSLGPLHCDPLENPKIHPTGAPLLPKLRGHFAEFLNESFLAPLSILYLAYLCRFAVRAPLLLPRGFSWQCEIKNFGTLIFPRHHSLALERRIFLSLQPHCLNAHFHPRDSLPSCVPPRSNESGGTGILTCCPSPTPFGLSLGPD